jgi:hypothetical protein
MRRTFILLILISIAFAPSLRSCGKISYGFPTVSIEAENPLVLEKFNPLNTLVNIIVLVVLFLLLKMSILKNDLNEIFMSGVRGLYAYQIILYFSYFVIYWLIDIWDKFALLFYVLYPFSTTIFNIDSPTLENFSQSSRFFGNEMDLVVRLNYLASLLLWFSVAVLIHRLTSRYKAKKVVY